MNSEEVIIRFVGFADGTPGDLDGMWLKTFDPDARNGFGEVTGTRKRAEALRFADMGTAMKCWRQPSTVKPKRADGAPNRPLTAFTIEIERV